VECACSIGSCRCMCLLFKVFNICQDVGCFIAIDIDVHKKLIISYLIFLISPHIDFYIDGAYLLQYSFCVKFNSLR
jgi:hypothetical protein